MGKIMALTFNTDVGSKILSNYLNKITKEIEKSTSRLTTGKKLSEDDPAGYVMVERLNNQISSSEVGLKNVQMAQSELSYREETLTSINSSLQSALDALKESQSATDNETERALLSTARAALNAADKLKSSAKFNGKDLYPAKPDDKTINLGDGSSISISAAVLDINFDFNPDGLISDLVIALEENIKLNQSNIVKLGVYNNMLSSTADNITNKIQAYESTIETISSVDVATETAKLTQNQILQQVTAALLSQQSSSAYLALSLITG